jgi:hypothetical protein
LQRLPLQARVADHNVLCNCNGHACPLPGFVQCFRLLTGIHRITRGEALVPFESRLLVVLELCFLTLAPRRPPLQLRGLQIWRNAEIQTLMSLHRIGRKRRSQHAGDYSIPEYCSESSFAVMLNCSWNHQQSDRYAADTLCSVRTRWCNRAFSKPAATCRGGDGAPHRRRRGR